MLFFLKVELLTWCSAPPSDIGDSLLIASIVELWLNIGIDPHLLVPVVFQRSPDGLLSDLILEEIRPGQHWNRHLPLSFSKVWLFFPLSLWRSSNEAMTLGRVALSLSRPNVSHEKNTLISIQDGNKPLECAKTTALKGNPGWRKRRRRVNDFYGEGRAGGKERTGQLLNGRDGTAGEVSPRQGRRIFGGSS